MISFKLLSLNLRGIVDSRKRRKVFSLLHKLETDIILLQETHSAAVKVTVHVGTDENIKIEIFAEFK